MAETLGHMLQDIKNNYSNKYPAAMRTVKSWKNHSFIGFTPTMREEIDKVWIEPSTWNDGKKAAMAFVPNGGPKSCNYGCLGFGNCVKACPFDAIHVVDGVAVVDKDTCKACGKCVAACPKHLIELLPVSAKHIVQCSSKDKGKDVMKACSVGCIGCHLCEKNCEHDAVHVIDNVAYIDQDKCVGCGVCAQKCPKKIILTK